MNIKPNKKYYFSVEGNTEKMYLDWLQELINKSEECQFKVKFDTKVEKNPKRRVKSLNIINKTEIFHLIDFEELAKKTEFESALENMRAATKLGKKVKYILGYSNYTFDLWMILHKQFLSKSLNHRNVYLREINKAFGTNFESLADYKSERNFKKILAGMTLDDVLRAIGNGHRIIKLREDSGEKHIRSHGFSYYQSNPALNLHQHIEQILADVGLIEGHK